MTIRIFTISHFIPEHYVSNEVFCPLVMGWPTPAGMANDMGGQRLEERSYAEMRAHYWVWKNQLDRWDFIGFQHYRRLFYWPGVEPADFDYQTRTFAKNRSATLLDVSHNRLLAYQSGLGHLDLAPVRALIGGHDIVTVRPWGWSVAEQFKQAHPPEYWPELVRAMRELPYWRTHPRHVDFNQRGFYPCNMFVMSRAEFANYMDFWWQVMQVFSARVQPPRENYQARLYGFLAERIFSLYLPQRRAENSHLKVVEIPHLTCNSWPKS